MLSTPHGPSTYAGQLLHFPDLKDKLLDLGPLRLRNMDAGHIALQVLSHAPVGGPSGPSLELCREANELMAGTVAENQEGRFASLAVLPMGSPSDAAAELIRGVRELGMKSALVDSNVNGWYIGGDEYDVFWQAASELDVPIYLHPNWPSEMMDREYYAGNYDEGAKIKSGELGVGLAFGCSGAYFQVVCEWAV